MTHQLIEILNTELDIELPDKISLQSLREKLAKHINYLIENNFQKLVNILYRVDVSELKLKTLLSENPGADSGSIIADLIVERQLQKIKSRQQFGRQSDDVSDEEKW